AHYRYGICHGRILQRCFKIHLFINILMETSNQTTTPEQAEQAQQAPPAKETKWYVLRVVSGKEKKVKEYLDKEIKISGWTNAIFQVLCPVEKVFKVQGGKKVLREKILFPGYLMLEAADGKLVDDIIQTIKAITGVIHFL